MLGLLATAAVAGCGGSSTLNGGFDAATITVSPATVSKVITDAYGDDARPKVRCIGRQSCNVTYTADQAVIGGDEQIRGTRTVFAAMFSDPRFRQAVITVRGPVITTGGREFEGDLFQVACTRGNDRLIDWQNVSAEGIREICDFAARVGGYE